MRREIDIKAAECRPSWCSYYGIDSDLIYRSEERPLFYIELIEEGEFHSSKTFCVVFSPTGKDQYKGDYDECKAWVEGWYRLSMARGE